YSRNPENSGWVSVKFTCGLDVDEKVEPPPPPASCQNWDPLSVKFGNVAAKIARYCCSNCWICSTEICSDSLCFFASSKHCAKSNAPAETAAIVSAPARIVAPAINGSTNHPRRRFTFTSRPPSRAKKGEQPRAPATPGDDGLG